MAIIKTDAPSMSEVLCGIRLRKAQNTFLNQIDKMVDWRPIRTFINKKYLKRANAAGHPAYDCILLFKMLLLQTWYNLSDLALEERVNDSVTFSRFLGLGLEDVSPDHSTLSRFRTALTELGVMDKLLNLLNKQPSVHHVDIREGAIIDASIVDSPHRPEGKLRIEVADDREDTRGQAEKDSEEMYQHTTVRQRKGADEEARWVKKNGKYRYGYKKHVLTNKEGVIRRVLTTPANSADISHFQEVVGGAELPKGTRVLADRGYPSSENRKFLGERKLKNGIMYKRNKGEAGLNPSKQLFNRLVSHCRYAIERTFGGIRRWFHGGFARYYGLKKTHTQNLTEAIAYNLYVTPGIIMRNSLKNV